MTPRTSRLIVRVSRVSWTDRLPAWWWIGPAVVFGLLVSGAPAVFSLGGAVALAAVWCRDLEDAARRN